MCNFSRDKSVIKTGILLRDIYCKIKYVTK